MTTARLGVPGDLRGRALWVVFGGLLCQLGLGFGYVFSPLAGDIIAEFGWTRAMYSSARAPQLWVISLASPLVGAMVLRFGARRVLIASALLLWAVFLAYSRVETLLQFSAVTVLMGLVVVGVGDITVGQLVAQWVTRSRGLALGIVYTGSNLGAFLLIPFAVSVADARDWRVALQQLSFLALFGLVPAALWLVRERPVSTGPADAAQKAAGQVGEAGDLSLKAALRTRSFWILCAALFTFFFYFLGLVEHLVLFLTDEGLSRKVAAGHLRTALALGILSKIALGVLADRIPHRGAMLLDYALLAASSIVLLMLPSPAWVWVFVVSFGFATAARDVVYPLVIIHCFGARHLAPIYGAIMLAMAPGGSLGPIFAAAVQDRFGSYQPAFLAFAALNLLVLAALGLLRDERRSTD